MTPASEPTPDVVEGMDTPLATTPRNGQRTIHNDVLVDAVEAAMVARMKQAVVIHKPCGCAYSPLGPSTREVAEAAITAYESARGDVKPEWEDVFREIERAVEDGQKIADTTDAILALLNGGADRD